MSKRTKRGPHNRELATAGAKPPSPPVIKATIPSKIPPGGASKYAPTLTDAQAEAAKTALARKLAMAGFAVTGGVAGVLAGLNHWSEAPASVQGAYAMTVWLGAALGDLSLDWVRGILTGVMGLTVGLTLGATIGWRSPKMLASWVLGGLAMGIGLASTGSPLVGAIGWLLGMTIAMKAPIA